MAPWLIAAFAIGSLVVVTLVVIALFWLEARRTEKKRRAEQFTDEEAEAILREVFADRLRCLTEETREHDLVADPRRARQIHGRTAPELAAELAAAEDTDEWAWARIQQELSCDADFMAIARGFEAEFRNQT
jgi:flagellar biosynthesis/type III secretory pathway M-ring protein FliF/YscJ